MKVTSVPILLFIAISILFVSGCTARESGVVPPDQAQFTSTEERTANRNTVTLRFSPAFSDDLELLYDFYGGSEIAVINKLKQAQQNFSSTLLFEGDPNIDYIPVGGSIVNAAGPADFLRPPLQFAELHPGQIYNRALNDVTPNELNQAMAKYKDIKEGFDVWGRRTPSFELDASCHDIFKFEGGAGRAGQWVCQRLGRVRIDAVRTFWHEPPGRGLLLDWLAK